MREIKFRAYITYGYTLQLGFIDTPDLIDFKNQRIKHDSEWYENDRFKLMQSTGLKDKNGVEIFEGDIIDLGGRKEFIHKIQREKSTGYLKLVPLDKRWSESYFTNFEDKTVFEVIGNIYENPDFLEVK